MLKMIYYGIRYLMNSHRTRNAIMDSKIKMLTCDYEKALDSNNVAYKAVFDNYLIVRTWGRNPLDERNTLDLILREADEILFKINQGARI